jgi:hypothetical protein
LLVLGFLLLRQSPFLFVFARNNSVNVEAISVDQGYFREIWGMNNKMDGVKIPPFVFLTLVDEKQENPLKITIGNLNFDGFISTTYDLSFLGLASFVRLNIDRDMFGQYKESNPGYLVSLAFERSVVLSTFEGQVGVDYLKSREINEEIGSNLVSFYEKNSFDPIKVEMVKPK